MKNNALLQILLEDAFCHVKKIIIRMSLGKKNIQNLPQTSPSPPEGRNPLFHTF